MAPLVEGSQLHKFLSNAGFCVITRIWGNGLSFVTVKQANLSFLSVKRTQVPLLSVIEMDFKFKPSLMTHAVCWPCSIYYFLYAKPFKPPVAALSLISTLTTFLLTIPWSGYFLSLYKPHCDFDATQRLWDLLSLAMASTAFPGRKGNCRQIKASQVCPWQECSPGQASTVYRKFRLWHCGSTP